MKSTGGNNVNLGTQADEHDNMPGHMCAEGIGSTQGPGREGEGKGGAQDGQHWHGGG